MKRISRRSEMPQVIVLAVLVVGLAGLIGAWPQVSKSGAGQDRVGGFLDLVMKATSLDQVSRAFERGRFSEADARRIEAAVRKEPYRSKLAGLKPKLPPVRMNQFEVSRKAVSGKRRGTSGSVSKAVARTSSKPASGTKTAAAARATRAKPVPAKPASAPAISTSDFEAITRQPGGGTEARISRVNPAALWAGLAFTISGSRFGRGRGSVEILLGRRRYICDLESWRDAEIRAVVPEYMESVIGNRTRDALLWVKPAGESLGPTNDITLKPQPSPPGPEILSLGGTEIGPGDDLAVRGRNFGTSVGTAWCEFGGTRFDLDIRAWNGTDVRVHVPGDLGGIPKSRGRITLRTAGGQEAKHSLGFVPVLEDEEIWTTVELEGTWSLTETETLDICENCQPFKNGWKIMSYRLEKVSGSGSYRYMMEPDIGSSVLYHIVWMNTAPFSDLRVRSIFVIRGPRGTDF